jgi:hypothetical protein
MIYRIYTENYLSSGLLRMQEQGICDVVRVLITITQFLTREACFMYTYSAA